MKGLCVGLSGVIVGAYFGLLLKFPMGNIVQFTCIGLGLLGQIMINHYEKCKRRKK